MRGELFISDEQEISLPRGILGKGSPIWPLGVMIQHLLLLYYYYYYYNYGSL